MTVTAIEIPIRDEEPRLAFRFEVDFDETSATVAYRAARTVETTSRVLSVAHSSGRGLQVDWTKRWRAYLAPSVRGALVAEVQQLLIRHHT